MSSNNDERADETSDHSVLDEVIAQYIRACEAGQPPDRDELLAAHPDLADELRAFFANRDQLDQVARPVRQLKESLRSLPQVGDKVHYFGDYELLEEIGRGGMGVIYKARQVSLDRMVALKMIIHVNVASPTDLERFRAEAEAAAALDHANIVPIYEIGEHEGQQYFTMKLVEGGNLRERLNEGPLPPREAARLMATIARAVHYAHQHAILHRDLKPANILLSARSATHGNGRPTTEPLVADFGLAKHMERETELTATGAVMGTPSYMSPEQAAGGSKNLTTASDVYSLGAMLYAMLTGRPPVQGDSYPDVLRRLQQEVPDRPRKVNPQVNRDLELICLKCLEKDADDRYSSAGSLANDLERYLAGEPIQIRRASSVERAIKWARRKPARAGLLAVSSLAAVVFVLGLIVSNKLISDEQEETELALQRMTEEKELKNDALEKLTEEQGKTKDALEKLRIQQGETSEALAIAEEERDNAKSHLYQAHTAHFRNAWEARNFGRLERLLEYWEPKPHEPDFRGWEARYLDRQCQIAMRTLPRDAARNRCLAWHPDGRFLATGESGWKVCVWDAQMGTKLTTFHGHGGGVVCVAWSPDGRFVATGSHDRSIIIWDVAKQEMLTILAGHDGIVRCLAWSPDGQRVASGGDDGILRIWEPKSTRQLQAIDENFRSIQSIDWCPNSQQLAIACPRAIRIWNIKDSQLEFELAVQPRCVAWNPDGTQLAVAGVNGLVRTWDATNWTTSMDFEGHKGPVRSVSWNPDGAQIVSAGTDHTVRLWDAIGGSQRKMLRLHATRVAQVAWNPQGVLVASLDSDGTICIFDPNQERNPATIADQPRGIPGPISWTADGDSLIYSTESGEVRMVDPASARAPVVLRTHDARPMIAILSPDGDFFACALSDGTIQICRRSDGKVNLSFDKHTEKVYAVDWSPDGRMLASVSRGILIIWEAKTGEIHKEVSVNEMSGIITVDWNPNGGRLAIGGQPNTIQVIDVEHGDRVTILRQHTGQVESVKWSGCGKLLASASDDGTVKIWDVENSKVRRTLRGHTHEINDVAWSPDDQRLASASVDGTIKIWYAELGEEVLTLRGHTNGVRSVAWSPDGLTLASCSFDGTVRVWDAKPVTIVVEDTPEWDVWVGHRKLRPQDVRFNHQAGPIRFLDLSHHENRRLDEALSQPGNHLGKVPRGMGRFAGVDFHVGNSYVQLRSSSLNGRRFPEKVEDIPVNQSFARLHILHGSEWSTSLADGVAIGDYLIKYDDGTIEKIPIVYGVDVRDWWNLPESRQSVSRGRVAWVGSNAVAKEKRRASLRLYLSTFENPNPDRTVTGISYLTRMADTASPFCVAMTIEGKPEESTKEPKVSLVASHNDQDAILLPIFNPSFSTHANGWATWYIEHGREYFNAARWNEAAHFFLSAIRLGANSASVWDYLGQANYKLNRWDVAIRCYSTAIQLGSTSWQTRYERGESLSHQRKWKECITDMSLAIESATSEAAPRADFYRLRADAYRLVGDLEKSAVDYLELAKLRPNDAYVGCEAAIIVAHSGTSEDYQSLCNRLLDRFSDTENPMTAHKAALACLIAPTSDENVARASELAQFAFENRRGIELRWAHADLALAALRQGDPALAVKWCNDVQEHQPRGDFLIRIRFILAAAFKLLGEDGKAREEFMQAKKLLDELSPIGRAIDEAWAGRLVCELLKREAEALILGSESGDSVQPQRTSDETDEVDREEDDK